MRRAPVRLIWRVRRRRQIKTSGWIKYISRTDNKRKLKLALSDS